MAASYLLALDQGTTSTRAILFDADGVACAAAQAELAHPGRERSHVTLQLPP